MSGTEAAFLHCPIRGQLRVRQRAKDGLTFTEEKRRIDAIKFLLQRDYPEDHFGIETRIMKLGHAGHNSLRADFSVYGVPWSEVTNWPDEKRLSSTVVVAEVKRENTSKRSAIHSQLKPALSLLPDMNSLGVYWDDVEQRFFYRELEGSVATIREAPISKMPRWMEDIGSTFLTFSDLAPSTDLSRCLRQNGGLPTSIRHGQDAAIRHSLSIAARKNMGRGNTFRPSKRTIESARLQRHASD